MFCLRVELDFLLAVQLTNPADFSYFAGNKDKVLRLACSSYRLKHTLKYIKAVALPYVVDSSLNIFEITRIIELKI